MELQSPLPPTVPSPDVPLAEIEAVFALQQAHRQAMRGTTAAQRIAKLKRLRTYLMEQRPAFEAALWADYQKPSSEVTLSEILPVLGEIKHAIRHLKRWMKPRKVKTPLTFLGTSARIRYEPKGVCLIISPWNYPVNLALMPLVSALAAGNTAMLKPSEFTPHTSRLLKTFLGELFDPREVAVFEGDHRVAQALLVHPFDHVFFTGSPAVGKHIQAAAAKHLTSTTLELGGKSPTIVDETADLEAAAAKIAVGKGTNVGQTCIAPDYVYVHQSKHDALVQALKRSLVTHYGPARVDAPAEDLSRLVHDRHFQKMVDTLETARAEGATVAAGGVYDAARRYMAPTVLTGVEPDHAIMQEEIFGPLLPVLPYLGLDEVIETINRLEKPLTMYIFSKNRATIDRVLSRTSAGSTVVNDTLIQYIHPELPFGGVNHSGIGKSHGHAGFLAFSNARPVLRQHLKRPIIGWLYPPFTHKVQRLTEWVLKWFYL